MSKRWKSQNKVPLQIAVMIWLSIKSVEEWFVISELLEVIFALEKNGWGRMERNSLSNVFQCTKSFIYENKTLFYKYLFIYVVLLSSIVQYRISYRKKCTKLSVGLLSVMCVCLCDKCTIVCADIIIVMYLFCK